MKAPQREEVDIRDIWIPFYWRDPDRTGKSLGRAEFLVCVRFKRGHLSEYWVDPIQTHLTQTWHWRGEHDDFSVSSYEGLERPGAWLFKWCHHHKTHGFFVYSPPEAHFLHLNYHGLEFWRTRP